MRHSIFTFLFLSSSFITIFVKALVSSLPHNHPPRASLHSCDTHHGFFNISYVRFIPNPPVKGQKLRIEYGGYLNEQVPKGAHINLIGSFNSIQSTHRQIDICKDNFKSVGDCPLEPGRYDLIKEIEISEKIPDGNYTFRADIVTTQGERVTCLVLQAAF